MCKKPKPVDLATDFFNVLYASNAAQLSVVLIYYYFLQVAHHGRLAITIRKLDHLGLVAALCQELGIVPMIDAVLPKTPPFKVAHGDALVAMIVNGLGFHCSPLYLLPQFFANKPVEHLIGPGIRAGDQIILEVWGGAISTFIPTSGAKCRTQPAINGVAIGTVCGWCCAMWQPSDRVVSRLTSPSAPGWCCWPTVCFVFAIAVNMVSMYLSIN